MSSGMKRDEAWYAEYQAKRASRFTTGTQTTARVVDTTASKFGNVKTGGYHSKREAARAGELETLARAGKVKNLRKQVKYLLIPRQVAPAGRVLERACHYIADFVYEDQDGDTVVEDVKGYANDTWPLKRKLMLFVHGIRVQEIK